MRKKGMDRMDRNTGEERDQTLVQQHDGDRLIKPPFPNHGQTVNSNRAENHKHAASNADTILNGESTSLNAN